MHVHPVHPPWVRACCSLNYGPISAFEDDSKLVYAFRKKSEKNILLFGVLFVTLA